jgi:hypothetical protein
MVKESQAANCARDTGSKEETLNKIQRVPVFEMGDHFLKGI